MDWEDCDGLVGLRDIVEESCDLTGERIQSDSSIFYISLQVCSLLDLISKRPV